jgi:hypothetical protein
LADRPVLSLAVPMSDDVAYGIPIEPHEVRLAWTLMRERIDVLGRWPVAVCGWNGSFEDLLALGEAREEGGPAAVLDRARRLSAAQVIAEWHEWSLRQTDYYEREWPVVVDYALSRTRERVEAAPSAALLVNDAFPRNPLRLESGCSIGRRRGDRQPRPKAEGTLNGSSRRRRAQS